MRLLKGKAGFILVELIIATAILAAVIPLSKFFIDTIKATREAKIQQTANHLAQTYMEEYKAKDLEAIKTVENKDEEIDGRIFYVSVDKTLFLDSSDSVNCIGSLYITKESVSEIRLQLTSTQLNEGSEMAMAIPTETYTLELNDTSMELWKNNTYVNSVAIISPEGEPELDLFVENNPDLTLNVKNNLGKKLIINKIENKAADGSEANPKFTINIQHGKVGVRDNEAIESYQRGAHIIVTVKDKADATGEILAKVAQTRLIEWAHSQK